MLGSDILKVLDTQMLQEDWRKEDKQRLWNTSAASWV